MEEEAGEVATAEMVAMVGMVETAIVLVERVEWWYLTMISRRNSRTNSSCSRTTAQCIQCKIRRQEVHHGPMSMMTSTRGQVDRFHRRHTSHTRGIQVANW